MKSVYYKIADYIQAMDPLIYATIWLGLFALAFILVVKFFKIYNGTQKKFEKLSYVVLALLVFVIIVFLTNVRK